MNEQESVDAMLDMLTEQLDRSTVIELIDLYLKNSKNQIDQIKSATEINQISQLAHSIKSSSANLGANTLSAACLKLEKSPLLDESVKQLITEILRLHSEAVHALTNWKRNHLG